jgi:hypothetical protein
MKIIGLLVILNAFVLTGWWVSTEHPYKSWAVTACIIALFIGMFMILQDRAIEISLKGVGTIKAAAEQASTDASAIANIKTRIEAQGATIDLVAQSAKDAKELVSELEEKTQSTDTKLSALDKTMDQANSTLKEMERTTDFATTLLAAQNDNWESFAQLATWSNDKSFPLWETAANAYVKVRLSYAERITEPGFLNIDWSPGIDPKTLPLATLTQTYDKLIPIYHAHLVNVVWGRSDFSKKERMQFLVKILTDSNSLCARHFAAKHFVAAAGDADLKWQPFQIQPLLDWWKTHEREIK